MESWNAMNLFLINVDQSAFSTAPAPAAQPIRKPRYKTSLLGDNPKGAMSWKTNTTTHGDAIP